MPVVKGPEGSRGGQIQASATDELNFARFVIHLAGSFESTPSQEAELAKKKDKIQKQKQKI